MTPQTVNAYYNPTGNEIVFPAAILQPPFFDAGADDAVNLGGIGMVIAHEVSHAFDSSGSLYDEKGNYHVWWTDEDRAKFKALADRVVAYYDGQDGYEGRHVNGAQTLNENIADLGALNCITAIAEEEGADLKLLFGSYATIWASKYTPESMIRRLNTDVHSPARVRVNGVLGSTDAFYRTYPEIKEGDGMYVAPEKRVKIW
jgi:Predicted metalloendopeptidase